MKGKAGPADIKLSEGLMLLDGIAIPCTQIGQPEPVRKITAADDFIIPMFLMMPTLVGQETGFCSTNLILFTLLKLFDSVQSSSAKKDTGFLLLQVQYLQERSPEETIIVAELSPKFSDTFSKNDTDLSLTNLVEHHIETGDAKPLKQPPRRVPMA
jgi:hypothetical protein